MFTRISWSFAEAEKPMEKLEPATYIEKEAQIIQVAYKHGHLCYRYVIDVRRKECVPYPSSFRPMDTSHDLTIFEYCLIEI